MDSAWGGFLIPNLLLPFINRINSNSNSNSKRFCAITITTNCWTVLLLNVYMPTNYGTAHSHDTYLETLGELKGINNYVTSISFLFTFFVLHVWLYLISVLWTFLFIENVYKVHV